MACTGCIASKWQRQRSNPESLPVESVVVNIEHGKICVLAHMVERSCHQKMLSNLSSKTPVIISLAPWQRTPPKGKAELDSKRLGSFAHE